MGLCPTETNRVDINTVAEDGIIVPMTLQPPYRVLRDRIADVLADQARPMTAAELAGLLLPADLKSARRQVGRGLAQLEAAGHVVHRHSQWSTAQPAASTTR